MPSGIKRMMTRAASNNATVPTKAPNTKPIGVLTSDSSRLLPTAPMMTLVAPPTTTVIKAGATNCWPMNGAIDTVGANSAPEKPARPAPRLKVSM